MAGFTWKYNISGGRPLIQSVVASTTETLTKGDIGNIESGEVDLAVTGNNELLGAIQGAFDPADEKTAGVITAITSVTKIKVIGNPDAVYSTPDNNARLIGAQLDIAGTTGAQTLASSSGNEFIVVKRKDVTNSPTFVKIREGAHVTAE